MKFRDLSDLWILAPVRRGCLPVRYALFRYPFPKFDLLTGERANAGREYYAFCHRYFKVIKAERRVHAVLTLPAVE